MSLYNIPGTVLGAMGTAMIKADISVELIN